MTDAIRLAFVAGWVSMLGGVVSGMLMGLRFHRESWLGGYGSFRRRLVRLGHIAFFGLGFMNLVFAFSVRALPLPTPFGDVAALGFMAGAATMSAVCFLTAWREPFRHLFFIPVVSVLTGVVSVLLGWGLL